jgi:6-phosphogluconolactonase
MNRMFAYTGCRTTRERNARGKGIGVYRVEDGVWSLVEVQQTLDNPSFLALNKDQTVLYTVHGDGGDISSFRIDEDSGKLMHLNTQSCLGKNPVHLEFSGDGRHLLIANYASGNLAKLPVYEDGSLGQGILSKTLPGSPGPISKEQGSSHPHHIPRYPLPGRTSNWHIVPDKGLDTIFAINWQDRDSPTVLPHQWLPGSGPRHSAFHPTLPLVYVANELNCTMTIWSFDKDSGELKPLDTIATAPEAVLSDSSAAGIALNPSASALYISNRGDNSICVVQLDARTGMPGAVNWVSTQGDFPRFISLDPQGTFLYAANERSDTIVQFAVNQHTGELVPTNRVVDTGSPVSIVFKTH